MHFMLRRHSSKFSFSASCLPVAAQDEVSLVLALVCLVGDTGDNAGGAVGDVKGTSSNVHALSELLLSNEHEEDEEGDGDDEEEEDEDDEDEEEEDEEEEELGATERTMAFVVGWQFMGMKPCAPFQARGLKAEIGEQAD